MFKALRSTLAALVATRRVAPRIVTLRLRVSAPGGDIVIGTVTGTREQCWDAAMALSQKIGARVRLT